MNRKTYNGLNLRFKYLRKSYTALLYIHITFSIFKNVTMTYYYNNKRDIHKEMGELVTLWMQCINEKGSMLAITNCCIPRFLRELNMYELPLPPPMYGLATIYYNTLVKTQKHIAKISIGNNVITDVL